MLQKKSQHTHQTRSRKGRFCGHTSLWGCRCDCFSLSRETSVRGASSAAAFLLGAGACMHANMCRTCKQATGPLTVLGAVSGLAKSAGGRRCLPL